MIVSLIFANKVEIQWTMSERLEFLLYSLLGNLIRAIYQTIFKITFDSIFKIG